VSGKSDGYAFKVPLASLPLGNTELPCSYVYIPFEYVRNAKEKKLKYKFITSDKYLIGTDILNDYNMSVQFCESSHSNRVESVSLELTKHAFALPPISTRKEYTFYGLAAMVDDIGEVAFETPEGVLECSE
jgi:hypothetical protein